MEIVREKSSSGFSAARTNKQKPMLRHVEHPAPNDGQSKKERERERDDLLKKLCEKRSWQ